MKLWETKFGLNSGCFLPQKCCFCADAARTGRFAWGAGLWSNRCGDCSSI